MSRIRIALVSLAAVTALVGVLVGSSLAASPAQQAVVKPVTITVKASEYKFVLSSKTIAKPGTVIFKVTNTGQEPHNFVFLSGINKTTPLILPKKSATLKVTFKKKGQFTYECTVGEHAERGMIGEFKVK